MVGSMLLFALSIHLYFFLALWFPEKFSGRLFERQELKVLQKVRARIASAYDWHLHLCAVASKGHQCAVSPQNPQWTKNPFAWIKRKAFFAACGIPLSLSSTSVATERKEVVEASGEEHGEQINQKYVECLAERLQRNGEIPSRGLLLAFSPALDEDGKEHPKGSGLIVTNEYTHSIVKSYPSEFDFACSVHPFSPRWQEELREQHIAGARVVKWLPNSMNIHPAHPRCWPFYGEVKRLGMTLLVHTGYEHSVDGGFLDQHLGNPLFLRIPLGLGVRVIAAHCASEGQDLDWDISEEFRSLCRLATAMAAASRTSWEEALDTNRGRIASLWSRFQKTETFVEGKFQKRNPEHLHPSFQLWLRLMDEKEFSKLLYGDISSVIGWKRAHVLETLLEREDLHPRLLYGSDYPVPAVWVVVSTLFLTLWHRHLSIRDYVGLTALYYRNPLTFDLALKVLLVSRKSKRNFPSMVFERCKLSG